MLRGEMINTPAFDTRFVRPALRIIALYLSIIVIASITILKPAQAEGTVSPLVTYWGGWNSSGFNCAGLASISAVKSCEMAKGQKITDDAGAYAGKFGIHPSSCPGVTLNDAGPIAPYLDVFSVAFY